MLTDDDLTRDLRAAFHHAADADPAGPLTYGGPVPTVRRTPVWARAGWLALPVAAAIAATVVAVGSGANPDKTVPPSAGPAPSDSPAPGASSPGTVPALVTEEIRVLGMTLAYERPATADPLTYTLSSPPAVPDGAREITFPGMAPARAWVTTVDGEAVLYLDAPTRNQGRLMAMTSPGLDEAALEDLLRHGRRD